MFTNEKIRLCVMGTCETVELKDVLTVVQVLRGTPCEAFVIRHIFHELFYDHPSAAYLFQAFKINACKNFY